MLDRRHVEHVGDLDERSLTEVVSISLPSMSLTMRLRVRVAVSCEGRSVVLHGWSCGMTAG